MGYVRTEENEQNLLFDFPTTNEEGMKWFEEQSEVRENCKSLVNIS